MRNKFLANFIPDAFQIQECDYCSLCADFARETESRAAVGFRGQKGKQLPVPGGHDCYPGEQY